MGDEPKGRILLERVLNRMEAFVLSRYLDAHGIAVTTVEPPLAAALGEIPFLETPVEIVLEDPALYEEALAVMAQYRKGPIPVRGTVWTCPGCGEGHDPEFGACWKCGTQRP